MVTSKSRRAPALSALVLTSVTLSLHAHAAGETADATANTTSQAESLFQRARELMGKNDFAAACPLLEESLALEHGAGTLLALAMCHEASGKPATALREFRGVLPLAVRTNRPDRVMLAESHIQKLEATVPHVVVHIAPPEPRDLVVTIDETPIDRAALREGVPLDPGTHAVVARAGEGTAWRQTFVVRETGTSEVEVPPLASGDQERGLPSSAQRPDRTWGWVAFGIAAATASVGSVSGVLAFDAEARSRHECTGNQCSSRGIDLNSQARRDALVSDVSFVVAGAAIAIGVYVFTRRPASRASTTAMVAW
jgi:hypothetical protein